jgi:hypothetical protein
MTAASTAAMAIEVAPATWAVRRNQQTSRISALAPERKRRGLRKRVFTGF